jgi:hypothetical protein
MHTGRVARRWSALLSPSPRPSRRAKRALRFGALVGTAIALWASPATRIEAQGSGGRITGVVTDSSGAEPLSAVQLTLTSTTDRSVARLEARSDMEGRYAFPLVPAGSYTLEARRLGYQPYTRSNIAVAAGATVSVNVSMNRAALSLQAMVATGVVDPTSGTRVPFTVGKVTAENAPVPATNALETIQGKIAGISVVPSGQAGSGTNIILRTPTSINK